jgi:hypothetical protein
MGGAGGSAGGVSIGFVGAATVAANTGASERGERRFLVNKKNTAALIKSAAMMMMTGLRLLPEGRGRTFDMDAGVTTDDST